MSTVPKFKPGDVVRRIGRPFRDLKVGSTVVVRLCVGNIVAFEDVIGTYDTMYFELVTPKAIEVVYTEEEWE